MSFIFRGPPSGHLIEAPNNNDTIAWNAAIGAWDFVSFPPSAVSSVFGRIGAVVAATGDYDSDQVDNLSLLSGAAVSDALDGSIAAFKSQIHINPLSTQAAETGSAAAPFKTAAAALAFAAALALSGAVFVLPASATLTEATITLPNGGDWEFTSTGTVRASIIGNFVCTTAAQTVLRLTNLAVTGGVSGVASSGAGNFLYIRNTSITGNVNMTGAGGGFWFMLCGSGVTTFFGFGGSIGGTTTVTGGLFGNFYSFTGAISCTSTFEMNGCRIPASITLGAVGGLMINCIPAGASTWLGTGASPILVDGTTYRYMLQVGLTLGTAGTGVLLKTMDSNASNQRLVAANLGSTSFTGAAGIVPNALYEAVFSMELITAGTAGTAVPEIRYTDLNGAAVVVAIGAGLLVTAALGTKAQGVLPFVPNGATTPTFSVSGIVTPGPLSINMRIAYRRVD